MRAGVIYKLTNTVNGKFYVGQTTKPRVEQRFHEHVSLAKTKGNYILAKAIRKYGPDAFEISTISTHTSVAELNAAEIKAIAELQPQYNSTNGGDNGYQMTPQVRKKIAEGNADRLSKPVVCVDTGVVYPSTVVAARAFGISSGEQIARVCRGERLSTGGIVFRWYEFTYDGSPTEIPKNHVPIVVEKYCVKHRDYNKYKTVEFANKIRAAMLAKGQKPSRAAVEKAWSANSKPIQDSLGNVYKSCSDAAKYHGLNKGTIGRLIRGNRASKSGVKFSYV